jgi:hypothetical protein
MVFVKVLLVLVLLLVFNSQSAFFFTFTVLACYRLLACGKNSDKGTELNLIFIVITIIVSMI